MYAISNERNQQHVTPTALNDTRDSQFSTSRSVDFTSRVMVIRTEMNRITILTSVQIIYTSSHSSHLFIYFRSTFYN